MNKFRYWIAGGIGATVLLYTILGCSIFEKYNEHKIKKLVNEGQVLWFSSVLEENGFCQPNEAVRQLAYYHKNPQTSRLATMVRCLLDQPESLLKSSAYVDFIVRFFGSAIGANEDVEYEFTKLGDETSEVQREIVEAVLDEAGNSESLNLRAPVDINLLWAEYMATGDESPIRKIISVLSPSDTEVEKRMSHTAELSLIRNIPVFYSVNRIMEDEASHAKGIQRKRLDDILLAIDILFENANNSLRRGLNYAKLKQYDQALEEYREALRILPDYPAAYTNMAIAYEYKGDMDKAITYTKKAAEMNPHISIASYNLGRLHFLKREYDHAIEHYAKALQERPEKESYNHAIARAYQMKGDHENAAKYFKAYLKYAPHGEFEPLVKNYLASLNIVIEEDESDIVLMLERKEYNRLEEYFTTLLKTNEKDKDGYSLLANAYDVLLEPPGKEHISEKWIVSFQDWVQFDSSSHFANACLGMFYVNYAWEARGSGLSSSVVEDGRKLFRERLEEARKYLEQAYQLNQSDPIVPTSLLTVVRGLGLSKEDMEIQFERAMKADPSEFVAYKQKLTYLMPKWYGSKLKMFDFAWEAYLSAPANSSAPRILAIAHWEMYRRSKDKSYFKDPRVWRAVKASYGKVLEQFPESNEARNWLAKTAYLAGDYETAAQEFKVIGNDRDTRCWKSQDYFERTKKNVFDTLAKMER